MSGEGPEPSVDPAHLLACLRCFAEATQRATLPAAAAGSAGAGAAAPAAEAELGWEEAGSLVWDAAAMPDDAAYLLQELPDLPMLLGAALTATAAAESWRALEICLGIIGNLACHAGPKQRLLQQQGLPELLLDRILWLDDAASLAECCRCVASVLADDSTNDPAAVQRWWELLLRDETLGRLVWILENTLSTSLLEQSLSLLTRLVEGAAAGAATGASERQVVPQLLSLDLLPLLASVLTGWLARLHAEHQFAAFEEQPRPTSSSSWGAEERSSPAAGNGLEAPAEAAAASAMAASAPPDPEAEAPAELAAAAVVAAEVSEVAAQEALALLETLMAGHVSEQAFSAAGLPHALARMVGDAPQQGLQTMSLILLASMDAAGRQLLRHPAAVRAVLAVLAEPAARGATKAAEAELAEACWALLSSTVGELGRQQPVEGIENKPQQQDHAELADKHPERVDDVLQAAAESLDVLVEDWASAGSGLASHQAYVLGRLEPLLAARHSWTEGQQAALQAALGRCRQAPPHG